MRVDKCRLSVKISSICESSVTGLIFISNRLREDLKTIPSPKLLSLCLILVRRVDLDIVDQTPFELI